MTARHTLLGLYEAWGLHTETEGEAIRAGDWARVSECQQAKHKLQPLIQDWTTAARHEVQTRERAGDELERELDRVVAELKQKELSNQAWLSQQRTSLQARRTEAQQTVRTLRRVRQSYAFPGRSVWQSYS
jgi:hypothetical protein